MHDNFDPRVWNLFTGVALLSAGCGGRVAGSEAGESGETADTNPDGPEGGECVNSSDCPPGYGCYDGVCMYYPHHDGWIPYYDCEEDSDCKIFELCVFGYCESQGSPPEDCSAQGIALPLPIMIEVQTPVLSLTFADVDADGQDEIVAATQTELWVYDPSEAPVASPRQSGTVKAMTAGIFDMLPGEDLTMLVDEALVFYGSNGDGTFAMPITNLPPLGSGAGLLAAELDDLPPTDLLGWGPLGAFIVHNGEMSVIGSEPYQAAAIHEFGEPQPGFALRHGAAIDFFSLEGVALSGISELPAGPPTIARFRRELLSEYVSVFHQAGWSRVETRLEIHTNQEWVIPGNPERVYAGNLLGSSDDELVFIDDSGLVALQLNPASASSCWHELPVPALGRPVEVVFGNWDFDGYEEMAIRTDLGELVLFDGS